MTKRCTNCGALLTGSAVTCDLCGYRFQSAQTVAAPATPASATADPRIEEYSSQYHRLNIFGAAIIAFIVYLMVQSLFRPSLAGLFGLAVAAILIVAEFAMKAMIRLRLVELGYDRQAVSQWQREHEKDGCLYMLVAVAAVAVVLAFEVPKWYEELKESVTFTLLR